MFPGQLGFASGQMKGLRGSAGVDDWPFAVAGELRSKLKVVCLAQGEQGAFVLSGFRAVANTFCFGALRSTKLNRCLYRVWRRSQRGTQTGSGSISALVYHLNEVTREPPKCGSAYSPFRTRCCNAGKHISKKTLPSSTSLEVPKPHIGRASGPLSKFASVVFLSRQAPCEGNELCRNTLLRTYSVAQ